MTQSIFHKTNIKITKHNFSRKTRSWKDTTLLYQKVFHTVDLRLLVNERNLKDLTQIMGISVLATSFAKF